MAKSVAKVPRRDGRKARLVYMKPALIEAGSRQLTGSGRKGTGLQ